MSVTQIDNQKIHNQGIGLYFSDGLLDIFTGLGLLSAGGLMLVDLMFLIGVYPATVMPAWQVARKKTLGRLGTLSDAPYRARVRAVILGALMAGLLFFGLGLGAFFAFTKISPTLLAWLRLYFPILTGGLVAVFFSVTGLALGIRRFHLYAVFALALFVIGQLLGVAMPVLILILGGCVTLTGLVVYLRFLGEHP